MFAQSPLLQSAESNEFGEREQEADYIARLIVDVETDVEALQFAVELQTIRLDLADLLIAVAADPEVAARRPVEFLGAVLQSTYLYTPILTSHTFEDLRSTGNMGLLRSSQLKNLLYGYYGFDANQRQFQQVWFPKELRHLELAAGILSHEQAIYVQDTWMYFGPDDIEDVRAAQVDLGPVRAAAERFLARKELLDWLPQTRAMQLEQITWNTSILEKANELLDKLRD